MNVTIPEALHICPGCAGLCEGLEYCARCREELEAMARAHAARLGLLCSAQPRVDGVMPESRKLTEAQREALRGFIRAGVIAVGIGFWLWVAVDVFTKGRGL